MINKFEYTRLYFDTSQIRGLYILKNQMITKLLKLSYYKCGHYWKGILDCLKDFKGNRSLNILQ